MTYAAFDFVCTYVAVDVFQVVVMGSTAERTKVNICGGVHCTGKRAARFLTQLGNFPCLTSWVTESVNLLLLMALVGLSRLLRMVVVQPCSMWMYASPVCKCLVA